jgi:hypothetical protein
VTRLILILGFLKIGGVLAVSAFIDAPFPEIGGPYGVPVFLDFLLIAVFGAAAVVLVVLGRDDPRAVALGGCLLMIGTAFCARPLRHLTSAGQGPLLHASFLLDSLKLDIFIPWFLWQFVRDFPRVPASASTRRPIEAGIWVSAAAGVLFFTINLVSTLWMFRDGKDAVPAVLGFFAPKTGTGIYYMLMMVLTALALVYLALKARAATGEERRRVRLLAAGLILGLGPAVVEVLCEGIDFGYKDFMKTHPRAKGLVVFFVLCVAGLSIPVTTAYAVLVHRALDLKLIARRALQYALARYSAIALVAVPLVVLLGYLYVHRRESLDSLAAGSRLPLLLAVITMGIAALRYRGTLLDAIDRRFFREQYDARQILTLLVERIRSIHESASLASLVSREIDLALHLEGIAMMVLDPRSGMLSDPRSRARRLDASSALALTISNASDPLEVNLEDSHSPLARLPEKERHWLVDSGFRLIVPILARDGSLLGLVGLGDKKSGLPFLKEDCQLLHAIASSAAWVLEIEQDRSQVPQRSWRDPVDFDEPTPSELPIPAAEFAKECSLCWTLFAPYTVFCSSDSRRLEISRVPYVLPGKFRFEKRIGTGGMGVVYQGADLALGRHVAVKTLRRVSPEDAMRLRREARTAASVSHPHLAPVYGLETWQGTPMLVMELLEGGTLAHRIDGEGLPPGETVELGIAMSAALAQLHAADILHRDIKPTNIGYTRDGVPKLMDFGIARIVFDSRRETDLLSGEEDDTVLRPPSSIWNGDSGSAHSRRQFAGTLAYLSPEALDGQPADPSFDLWSLAIVLYECLLGRKIFTGADPAQLMARIRHGRVPEFSQTLPELDGVLGDFFRSALHRTRSRRPASAHEFRQRLESVRPRLT